MATAASESIVTKAPHHDSCTKCGEPWQGKPLDHLIEYRCRHCGYECRETSGGLKDFCDIQKAMYAYGKG